MTNPNPIGKQDYRTVKDPKLTSKQVLFWIIDNEKDFESFISREVSAGLGCKLSAASVRLAALKRWGCLRIIKKGKGNQPHQYTITEWGHKMNNKWRKINE